LVYLRVASSTGNTLVISGSTVQLGPGWKTPCVNRSSIVSGCLQLWPGHLLVTTTITWNSLSLADDRPCLKSITLSHPTPLPPRVNILTESLRRTRHISVNTGCLLPFRCAAYNSLYEFLPPKTTVLCLRTSDFFGPHFIGSFCLISIWCRD
jgi:hypothetical protein